MRTVDFTEKALVWEKTFSNPILCSPGKTITCDKEVVGSGDAKGMSPSLSLLFFQSAKEAGLGVKHFPASQLLHLKPQAFEDLQAYSVQKEVDSLMLLQL